MPAYDFKCDECNRVYEIRIKLADYDAKKNTMKCWEHGAEKPGCQGNLKRMMDYNGHFALEGSGWFGKGGEGTGYEITQTEMNNNLEESARMEDAMHDMMAKAPAGDEGE